MVPNNGVEVGDNPNGAQHVVAAHIHIGANAHNALFTQRLHGVDKQAGRLKGGLANYRFHHV